MNCLYSITFCLVISLTLITACSGTAEEELPEKVKELDNVTIHERDASPSSSITLTETVTFGNSDEVSFGRLNAVDVDNSGNVYIVEGANGNEGIYVFNPEGSFIDKIGRTGKGPGEFQSISDIDMYGNKVFTLDRTLLRIQAFSTETHNLIHEASLNPDHWDHSGERAFTYPQKFHVLNDSTILVGFYHYSFNLDTITYYHLDFKGDVISGRLLTHDFIRHMHTSDGSRSMFDPFGGRGLMAVSPDNHIYTAWSQEMLFKVYEADGTYERSFYHPFNNSELGRNEALNLYESETLKDVLNNEGIPEHWRAFEHFIIGDEDNLWVSTITDDRDIYEWWIMDSHGNLLAKFQWSRSKEIKTVKDGFAYALETEEETGLQEVVKYRISWDD